MKMKKKREELKSYKRKHLLRTVFVSLFGLLILVVPLFQLISEIVRDKSLQEFNLFRRIPTVPNLRKYENNLKERSGVAKQFRRRYQKILSDILEQGNQKAIVGLNGWLFYRPSVDYIIYPNFRSEEFLEKSKSGYFDPLPAILSFYETLKAQDVELILLPIPGKATVYPEYLSERYNTSWGPAVNSYTLEFFDRLRAEGIQIFDPTELFWKEKNKSDEFLYIPQDTHWSPLGMKMVASSLAERIKEDGFLNGVERKSYRTETITVENNGDIYDMLQLPQSSKFKPIQFQVERVLQETGEPYVPDSNSPIVLLGDSFTNIFSKKEMHWGEHAGFSEHLALELETLLDVIAINDGGPTTCRETLARRKNALLGKRLVIWQFTTRDLANPEAEWKIIEIPEPKKLPVVEKQGELTIVGKTILVSFVPEPVQVPYTDCLTYVKYRVLSIERGKYERQNLLAVFWGMRDSQLMPASKFKEGEKHKLILEPLDKHPELEHIMRADDTDEYELSPFWVLDMKPIP